jgi:hypothetical protein
LGTGAAVFPRLAAEDLAAQSQLIVEGTIVRSWAAWDSDHKYIWTHHEVSVTNQIRGPRSATIAVSEPGGSLDGINQQFSGVVSYSPGETAFLFLYQTPIGYWRSVGGPQGKFTVDSEGRVHGNAQGATFVDTRGRATGTSLSILEGLALGDFKGRVQRLAAAHPFREKR